MDIAVIVVFIANLIAYLLFARKGLANKALRGLWLVFMLALLLRLWLPIHAHIVYTDEIEHMSYAKQLLTEHSANGYSRQSAWPIILALAFALTLFFMLHLLTAYFQDRLFLKIYAILILLAAIGSLEIPKMFRHSSYLNTLPFVLVLVFAITTPTARAMFSSRELILETELVNRLSNYIPERCSLIMNQPVIAHFAGLEAFDTEGLLKDRKFREWLFNHRACVLFLEDYTCTVRWPFKERDFCGFVKKNFGPSRFADICTKGFCYSIYKLRGFQQQN